ncbi:MAG: LysM peptidoglycan-binding domain-containing protein [Patescibacteria group bacterium]
MKKSVKEFLNIFIVVILATFITLYLYKSNNDYVKNSVQQIVILPNKSECDYGVFDYPYKEHTVTPGESILSIATKELSDSSRVGEIIKLNKSKYPTLLSNPQNLEIGWKLMIPEKDISVNESSEIKVFKGHIHQTHSLHNGGVVVSVDENGSTTYLYAKNGSKYSNYGLISPGTCFEAKVLNNKDNTNSIITLDLK